MRAKLPKPRSLIFVGVNVLAATSILAFFVVPFIGRFADRWDQIADNEAQLARLASVRSANAALGPDSGKTNLFYAGLDEGAASAALQANLRAATNDAGVRFLGLQILPSNRSQDVNILAAALEIEGGVLSIRNVMIKLETQRPVLVIKSAVLRPVFETQSGVIHAELVIQGLMRAGAQGLSAKPRNPREDE